MKKVVAVDGPAGAGKSTVAKIVADKMGYTYIDTGAMYRAVAYKTLQMKKNVTDELILKAAADIDITLRYENGATRVFEGGAEITDKIRTPEINAIVSQVAKLGAVRDKMTGLQRKMAQSDAVIMDGRDIGTVVLPRADLKILLVASVEERAKRRHKELTEKGHDVSFEEIKKTSLQVLSKTLPIRIIQ